MNKTIDFGLVADLYDSYTNACFDLEFYKILCKGHNKILELMCGTGRVSVPLLRAGHAVTCVDYSEEMLDVFRRKVSEIPTARIICQDICELNLQEQFDLIFISFNSIAEIIDPRKRQQALKQINEHLVPGGIFFCTLYHPEYQIAQADGVMRYLGRYEHGIGEELVITNYQVFNAGTGIINGMQFYETYRNNRLKEKRFLELKFAVITREEICSMAQQAGFFLKAVYGDYAPHHFDEASNYMNLLFQKSGKHKNSYADKCESRKK